MGDNDASSSNAAAAAGHDGGAEVSPDGIGKVETSRDGTPSSMESTPEQEAGAETANEPAQPQKRKGGRKPVCVTALRSLHVLYVAVHKVSTDGLQDLCHV